MSGLGRIYAPDERDRNYLMERHLPQTATPIGRKLWAVPHLYDQGPTPQCVGYSCSGAMTALEAVDGATVVFDASALYAWANTHDGDTSPHDGSTVRAGFQGLLAVGGQIIASTDKATDAPGAMDKVANFLWADTSAANGDIDRLIEWILTISPVVIGIDWHQDSFTPDVATGYIPITGALAGGHAIMVRGVNADDPAHTYFVLRNSWNGWGVTVKDDFTIDLTPGGDGLMTKADMIALLTSNGEAGALVASLDPAPVPPAPIPVPTPGPVPFPPPSPTPTPVPPAPNDPSIWRKVEAVFEKAEAEVKNLLGMPKGDDS